MTSILAITLAVAIVSALVPIVNLEFYVVALLASNPTLPWLLVALLAAMGQMVGKVGYYFAGAGGRRIFSKLRTVGKSGESSRWAAELSRFKSNCHDRMAWPAGFLLISASVGIPPFAVVSVAAGAVRIRLMIFVVAGFVGRFARFGVFAAAPTLVLGA